MLRNALSCSLLTVALTMAAGSAVAQRKPEAEAWRKKTIETYRLARPTAELASMSAADKLLAIEEIRQLPLRYTRCINQRDWDCWTNLFTEESDYYNGTLGVVKGRKGWHDHLVATGMTSSRVHSLFHNYGGAEIELLSPTAARGVWQASFVFYSGADEKGDSAGTVVAPGQQVRVYGVYYQTYKKVAGQWQINSNIHLDLRSEKGPMPEGVTAVEAEAPPNSR